jgi:hypothetical protein
MYEPDTDAINRIMAYLRSEDRRSVQFAISYLIASDRLSWFEINNPTAVLASPEACDYAQKNYLAVKNQRQRSE